MYIRRRIYEDIRSLKIMGLDGFVEDGSQRSFFPNGFHMYIFAEALMNRACDYEAVLADYLSHIYGDAWQDVKAYLQKVSDTFDFAFMSGERSADPKKGNYYDPARAEIFAGVKALADEGRAIAEKHMTMPTRPQTVSMRLLLRHAEYIEGIASFVEEQVRGNETAALEKFAAFAKQFGKHEFEIERYFDHYLAVHSLSTIGTSDRAVYMEGF